MWFQKMILALQLLDLFADRSGLLGLVPRHPGRGTGFAFVAVRRIGEQRPCRGLLWLWAIRPDAAPRMWGCRTVVALQPHHGGAGKVVLEAQDVADLRAAPAIDRLVVVADATDVAFALGQKAQPQVLRDVGILILVDQDVAETALIVGKHVLVLCEELEAKQEEIAEIGGVQTQSGDPGSPL